ncbi:transglycosylase-like protein with SLT domain [Bosea sp. BK604]|nr:transglycosylase-like protein with SLT domain [Bosea sp. BK604]
MNTFGDQFIRPINRESDDWGSQIMIYSTRGSAVALLICLASLQTACTAVNGETGAAAPLSGDGEKVAQDATTKTRGKGRRQALAAPAGSEAIRQIIARHAAANGVPFSLADAVVRVESRYNPRASNAGNFGLMQIRHQTARGLGYSGGAGGLLDAETNARFGMKYLAQAYRLAGGDTCRTIMKYQSGHLASRLSGANRAYCAKVRTISAQNS